MSLLGWIAKHPVLAAASAGIVAALLTRGGSGAPARVLVSTHGTVNPPGPEYAPEHLPSFHDHATFVRVLRAELAAMGMPAAAIDLFIAHLGRETGFGDSVVDNNFGNVRAFANTTAPWYRHRNGYPYRAYLSMRDGLSGALAVVRGARYAAAYRKLLAGDPTWYSDLGIAGYYEAHVDGRYVPATAANIGAEQADYQRSLNGVRAVA